MSDRPTFPIIISDISGYLALEVTENSLKQCSALGLMKEFYKNWKVFDKNGVEWKVDAIEVDYKINALTKLLAHTFYDPTIKIGYKWALVGEYTLEDLKNNIYTQIDKDDDILTQFSEADTIKKSITRCSSFKETLEQLNKLIFKPSEEELEP